MYQFKLNPFVFTPFSAGPIHRQHIITSSSERSFYFCFEQSCGCSERNPFSWRNITDNERRRQAEILQREG